VNLVELSYVCLFLTFFTPPPPPRVSKFHMERFLIVKSVMGRVSEETMLYAGFSSHWEISSEHEWRRQRTGKVVFKESKTVE